jgi:DNA replication protein DnaC
VWSADEIRAAWPTGIPGVAGLSGRLEGSGIPRDCWGWSVDSFAKKFGKDAIVTEYLALAKDWFNAGSARTDIVLYGPNGTGKTGLAIAMLRVCIKTNEHPVRFVRADKLSMTWRDTFRPESKRSELQVLASFEKQQVLVIDEVGGTTEFRESMLTMLVDARQKARRPTLLTLNLAAKEPDPTRALAEQLGPTLYDRLRERAQFWPMEGRSRRRSLDGPRLIVDNEPTDARLV